MNSFRNPPRTRSTGSCPEAVAGCCANGGPLVPCGFRPFSGGVRGARGRAAEKSLAPRKSPRRVLPDGRPIRLTWRRRGKSRTVDSMPSPAFLDRALTSLRFDNAFVRDLPGDSDSGWWPRQVVGALYSRVDPTPVAAPRLIAWSAEMAALLGLEETEIQAPEFAQIFAGNALVEGMEPFAANYGGHQFGQWAGQLGDGRAITLGEAITAAGERWELQLKGAGPTPYSRTADGRAVLRSSVREFLCSEAMHHLGIPTTRALCLVTTGEQVMRDMFYDGHPALEAGAIVCRVAPSFIRFGNFELPASRHDIALLEKLVDFTIRRDFPELGSNLAAASAEEVRAAWFAEVCERTAR